MSILAIARRTLRRNSCGVCFGAFGSTNSSSSRRDSRADRGGDVGVRFTFPEAASVRDAERGIVRADCDPQETSVSVCQSGGNSSARMRTLAEESSPRRWFVSVRGRNRLMVSARCKLLVAARGLMWSSAASSSEAGFSTVRPARRIGVLSLSAIAACSSRLRASSVASSFAYRTASATRPAGVRRRGSTGVVVGGSAATGVYSNMCSILAAYGVPKPQSTGRVCAQLDSTPAPRIWAGVTRRPVARAAPRGQRNRGHEGCPRA